MQLANVRLIEATSLLRSATPDPQDYDRLVEYRELWEHIVRLCEHLAPVNPQNAATLFVNCGINMSSIQANLTEAETTHQHALTILERTLGPEQP